MFYEEFRMNKKLKLMLLIAIPLAVLIATGALFAAWFFSDGPLDAFPRYKTPGKNSQIQEITVYHSGTGPVVLAYAIDFKDKKFYEYKATVDGQQSTAVTLDDYKFIRNLEDDKIKVFREKAEAIKGIDFEYYEAVDF